MIGMIDMMGMLHFPLYTFSNEIPIFRDSSPEKCKVLWR